MDQALLTLLQQVDTPTVCNGIEVAQAVALNLTSTHAS